MLLNFVLLLFLCLSFTAASSEQLSDQYSPEYTHHNGTYLSASQNLSNSKQLLANNFIAVTAHPLASQASYEILKKGGNAIDAAIAAQFMLGLVEPQSSGLGGGAFLVYYDAKSKTIRTYDARETAPEKVTPNFFMADSTKAMDFFSAVIGGRSVGVPGTVKLLDTIHEELGSLEWKELISAAIKTANEGFKVTPRLANAVSRDIERLKSDKVTYNYFAPSGRPINSGLILKNPEYAATLQLISEKRAQGFYSPPFSTQIIDKVQNAKNPGYLSQKDFDEYRVIKRSPVCFQYKVFDVCGMGPPSSGQVAIAQIMGIVENFNITSETMSFTDRWQIISDASQLAFADRGKYIADPQFTPFNKHLLDKKYLSSRSSLIKPGTAIKHVKAGDPNGSISNLVYASSPELPSTSHFVIVDRAGNIVSMTSTIENGFGSRLMVNGFLLNNELTDFSFNPTKNGQLVANRVGPGKRPRSSMAPTIVFENKSPLLAIGSPGGSRIINYVANTIIKVLEFKQPLLDAINSPHIVNRFGKLEVEKDQLNKVQINRFREVGYEVVEKGLNSGIHAVLWQGGKLLGAADHRREGTVLGE